MSLSTREVLHLSALANLTLNANEIKTLKGQLSGVIDYFEDLKKLRTDGVISTSQTTKLEDVLREDKIDSTRVLPQEAAVSGTDNIYNGSFVVPQVIDKDQ